LRRPIARASLFALFVAFAATAHVAVSANAADCALLESDSLREATESASVILVANVVAAPNADNVVLRPETYFKGAADGREFVLTRTGGGECPDAKFSPGDRILMLLSNNHNQLAWPDESRAFVLDSGTATNAGLERWSLSEDELSDRIRALTGQASVPAVPGDDGPTVDWVGTVLPLTAALLVVFAIGLAMMRVWHRIDPS
jgi:hypothetical protein